MGDSSKLTLTFDSGLDYLQQNVGNGHQSPVLQPGEVVLDGHGYPVGRFCGCQPFSDR